MYAMARFKDREEAIRLRKSGNSYKTIRTLLQVSKSSLSLWLRDVQLTKKQINKINSDGKSRQIESYLRTVRARQERILKESYVDEKKILGRLSVRDYL